MDLNLPIEQRSRTSRDGNFATPLDACDSPSSICSSPGSSPTGEVAVAARSSKSTKNSADEDDDGPTTLMYDHFELTDFTEVLEGADFTERRDFMMDPLPEGTCIHCRVVREKASGIASPLKRRRLIFQTDEGVFLAAAKKTGSAEYVISLEQSDVQKNGMNYLGRVKSSMLGGACTGYDSGASPKNTGFFGPLSPKKGKTEENVGPPREELVSIRYIAGINLGPRRIQAAIPNPELGDNETPRNKNEKRAWKEGLLNFIDEREKCASKNKKSSKDSPDASPSLVSDKKFYDDTGKPLVLEYKNRKPVKSAETGHYTLDFGTRVQHPSVKNFQLCKGEEAPTIFQYGRLCDNEFSLDFAYPLSPYQALCIALSSMEFKIGV